MTHMTTMLSDRRVVVVTRPWDRAEEPRPRDVGNRAEKQKPRPRQAKASQPLTDIVDLGLAELDNVLVLVSGSLCGVSAARAGRVAQIELK